MEIWDETNGTPNAIGCFTYVAPKTSSHVIDLQIFAFIILKFWCVRECVCVCVHVFVCVWEREIVLKFSSSRAMYWFTWAPSSCDLWTTHTHTHILLRLTYWFTCLIYLCIYTWIQICTYIYMCVCICM